MKVLIKGTVQQSVSVDWTIANKCTAGQEIELETSMASFTLFADVG